MPENKSQWTNIYGRIKEFLIIALLIMQVINAGKIGEAKQDASTNEAKIIKLVKLFDKLEAGNIPSSMNNKSIPIGEAIKNLLYSADMDRGIYIEIPEKKNLLMEIKSIIGDELYAKTRE